MYLNSHFVITTGFLAWLYLRRNEHFYFVRNMFLVAMGLALVGYALLPDRAAAAVPEPGLHRHDRQLHRRRPGLADGEPAAEPVRGGAEHAHRLLADGRGARRRALSRHAASRALWSAYPLMVFFVIVATGNHYWFDAVAGARRRRPGRGRRAPARPPAPRGLVVAAAARGPTGDGLK